MHAHYFLVEDKFAGLFFEIKGKTFYVSKMVDLILEGIRNSEGRSLNGRSGRRDTLETRSVQPSPTPPSL